VQTKAPQTKNRNSLRRQKPSKTTLSHAILTHQHPKKLQPYCNFLNEISRTKFTAAPRPKSPIPGGLAITPTLC
jgi:hypothetical protein